LLSFKFDKTYFIHFTNKSIWTSDIQIMYEDKIRTVIETKFLGLFIHNNLSWKTHVECIKSKLSSAFYSKQSVILYVSLNTLHMIYYSYFHSVIANGLLFWWHSSESTKFIRLQKKVIRIMMGCSQRKLYFNLGILPLPSQYILSLLLLVRRNKNQFLVKSEI